MAALFSLLIFFNIKVFHTDSSLLFFKPGLDEYEEAVFGEKITGLAQGKDLYLLTEHYLYKIDPEKRLIKQKNYLPFRLNSITLQTDRNGDDSLLIILSIDEIILIDPVYLSYAGGIGIPPGDREIISTLIPGLIYLIVKGLKSSLIEIYDLKNGQRRQGIRVDLIRQTLFNPATGHLYLFAINGDIRRLTLNLRDNKKLLNLQPPILNAFILDSDLVVVTTAGIYLIEIKSGRVLDHRPMKIDGAELIDSVYLLTYAHNQDGNLSSSLSLLNLVTMTPIKYISLTESIEKSLPLDSNTLLIKTAESYSLINLINGEIQKLKCNPIILSPGFETTRIAQDSCYYIQVGAFSQISKARAVIESLLKYRIPAFCDSSSRFFRIRVGGFINREEAELFNTVFGAKNWLVFTAKDQSRVLPASSLCAFNGQNTLFVFRYDSGTLRLIHKIENFIKDYQGNPVIKDSTIEIRRNDGRKSIFYFKTGGIYEEIRDIQD